MLSFLEPILYGRLIKRYKRFFMDVELTSGEIVTAHVANTGSMLGLLEPNSQVLLTKTNDKKRSLVYTAQAIKIGQDFVGINTHAPNKLIKNSLSHPLLQDFLPYQSIKAECPYGQNHRSRVDFKFFDAVDNSADCFLEIKNVTYKNDMYAEFPDTVSTRAQKHIEDLLGVKNLGFKAGLIFLIQRQDCQAFRAAQHIDPQYAGLLKKARDQGVFIRALCAAVTEAGISITHEIPCYY